LASFDIQSTSARPFKQVLQSEVQQVHAQVNQYLIGCVQEEEKHAAFSAVVDMRLGDSVEILASTACSEFAAAGTRFPQKDVAMNS